MTMTTTSTSRDDSKTPFKRNYNKPILNIYGNVSSLTAAGSGKFTEDRDDGGCDSSKNRSKTVQCP
jgi:hypothetical protein